METVGTFQTFQKNDLTGDAADAVADGDELTRGTPERGQPNHRPGPPTRPTARLKWSPPSIR
jgi:hypothetical protein